MRGGVASPRAPGEGDTSRTAGRGALGHDFPSLSLTLRNLLFTVAIPGAGGVAGPWLVVAGSRAPHAPTGWWALAPFVLGALLYLWAVADFAVVGKGTPGYWDSPRSFVAVGPYGWVRNPIYIAALLIVGGEAGLFMSLPLLEYLAVMALSFQLLVVGYEEPHLVWRFGDEYLAYRRRVRRWLPRIPAADA
jgi:protein-S-isoprenylcysteine O-methyltransferase Ste14